MTGAGKTALLLSLAVHAAAAGALSGAAVGTPSRPGPSRVELRSVPADPPSERLPEPEEAETFRLEPPEFPPPVLEETPPPEIDPRFAYDALEPRSDAAGPPGDADSGILGLGRGGPLPPVRRPAPPAPDPGRATPTPAPAARPEAGPSRRASPLAAACAAPIYPDRERRRGIEGLVELRVAVAADGSVESVEVALSSGSAALDRAALAAVRAWRFEPALARGLPARDVVLVPVRFLIR